MGDKLRVAVAGTGYFSTFHFDAWSRCSEVDLVGVAGLDSKAVAKVSEQHQIAQSFGDVAEMLEQTRPDVLDIATPPQTHLELIETAASRNINVICQKPFCGTLEDAQRAVEIAGQSGIDLVVHENFRFQPWYSAIKRELYAGRLGPVYRAHFRLRPGDDRGRRPILSANPIFRRWIGFWFMKQQSTLWTLRAISLVTQIQFQPTSLVSTRR